MAAPTKRKLIIDTDVGLDDAEAITYLLSCQDVDVIAFTLVAGNADIPTIRENMLKILAFLERTNIPIYQANSFNMLGTYVKSDGYFGDNAFANIQLPHTDVKINSDMHCANALVHFARKFPHQVSFLFIGPLTNLAMAFLLEPDFGSLCDSITIMGGDRDQQTFKNASPHAEFNFLCDPLAARIVANNVRLPSNKPILLVDWHHCWNHLLPVSMFERALNKDASHPHKNNYLKLLAIIRDFHNDIIRRSLWDDGFLTADTFAAMAWHSPQLIAQSHRTSLHSIDLEGPTAGHSVFQDDPDGPFLMIDKIHVPLMADEFVQRLTHP